MRPKSNSVELPPDFAERVSGVLRLALEEHGWRFSCEKSEFTPEEVTAADGLLPMWLNRAQELMQKAYSGVPAHMSYQIDGGALCAVRPAPEERSASLATWLLFTHFAIEDWRSQHLEYVQKNEPVPMDALFDQWKQLVSTRSLPLQAPRPVPNLVPGLTGAGVGGLQAVGGTATGRE